MSLRRRDLGDFSASVHEFDRAMQRRDRFGGLASLMLNAGQLKTRVDRLQYDVWSRGRLLRKAFVQRLDAFQNLRRIRRGFK